MNIRVFTCIDEPELVTAWKRFDAHTEVFPQLRYSWCACWWQHLRNNQRFYLIAVINDSGTIAGISPLCIEKRFGIRFLRSFPIRFGDFYDFLVFNHQEAKEVIRTIFDYLVTFKDWDFVRLDNVREDSLLVRYTDLERKWEQRSCGKFLETSISGSSWEDFVQTLGSRVRRNIRVRLRKIEASGHVTFKCIDNHNDFEAVRETLASMYSSRLNESGRHRKTAKELFFRNELITNGFRERYLLLLLLELDEKIIAYRFDLVSGGCYYDWNISFDVKKKALHPGICSMAYTLRFLIREGFERINFMSGVYPWKRDFAAGGEPMTKLTLFTSSHGWMAFLYRRALA